MNSLSRLALSLVLAATATFTAACGDDGGPDPMPDPDPDPIPMPQPATFSKFVVDLVQNQTKDNTAPVDFAAFSTLDDPDTGNPATFSSLF